MVGAVEGIAADLLLVMDTIAVGILTVNVREKPVFFIEIHNAVRIRIGRAGRFQSAETRPTLWM